MAVIDTKGVIHGSVSNIVYRSWRDLNVVQMKPNKVKQTLSSKEASLEFGLCSSTARIIRQAFKWTYKGYDGGMINRCTSAVRKAVSASAKERGERDIHDGDMSFLKGFQFNNNSPVDKVLRVRASAELSQENKVIIHLPAVTENDIRGCDAAYYIIRFTVVAFDFRKRVYSYVSTKDIRIGSREGYAGGSMELDELVPEGRLVAVCMSIHAYSQVFIEEMETVNSSKWSPAELLNVWQLPSVENMDIRTSKITKSFRANDQDWVFDYEGLEMLKRIAKLRDKAVKVNKPSSKLTFSTNKTGPDLPKGDIKF
ncbi:hypothetical protein [Desertivirga brevis]|uniref:hypothetical protein n=1 Tax=Desertivirga brevis TaxID=2810310 RepID=UPI001A958854|nr:hypothetical protein [Pedobacter sp. SYSU D00873]